MGYKWINRLLSLRSSPVIGMDLGNMNLKLLQLSSHADYEEVDNAYITAWPQELRNGGWSVRKDVFADFWQHTLAKSGMNGKYFSIVLDDSLVYTRELKMPDLNKRELGEAVKWDALQCIPYEEASYGYDFISRPDVRADGSSGHRVFIAAVQNHYVDTLMKTINTKHSRIISVTSGALALCPFDDLQADAIVIDVGERFVHLTVFEAGQVCLQYSLELGLTKLRQSLAVALNIPYPQSENMNLGFKYAPMEHIEPIRVAKTQYVREIVLRIGVVIENNGVSLAQEVFLIGGGVYLPELKEGLEQYFQGPISVLKALNGINIARHLDSEYIENLAPQLALAVGAALGGLNSE